MFFCKIGKVWIWKYLINLRGCIDIGNYIPKTEELVDRIVTMDVFDPATGTVRGVEDIHADILDVLKGRYPFLGGANLGQSVEDSGVKMKE